MPTRRRVSTAGCSSPGYLAHLFDRLPAGVLLDIGSGNTGGPSPGRVVVHLDHVPTAVAVDRFVVGDALSLPFSSGSFDGLLLKDVLEHVDDCLGLLMEARRVAQDGGRLIVQVPRAIPRAVWDDPTHVRGFTKRALLEAMSTTGWTPTASPRRVGGFPGAGRLGLERWLTHIMRIPGFGHWFGKNWIVEGVAT